MVKFLEPYFLKMQMDPVRLVKYPDFLLPGSSVLKTQITRIQFRFHGSCLSKLFGHNFWTNGRILTKFWQDHYFLISLPPQG